MKKDVTHMVRLSNETFILVHGRKKRLKSLVSSDIHVTVDYAIKTAVKLAEGLK